MAVLSSQRTPPTTTTLVSLLVRGPAGASIYVDNVYRGAVRPTGDLRIEPLTAGPRRVAVDMPGGESFEQVISLHDAENALDLNKSPEYALARLEETVRREKVLGPGGELYQMQAWASEHRIAAEAIISSGLERQGQQCVSDYVQSTAFGLKRSMLMDSVEAYKLLKTLRPFDKSLEAKESFCQGRAQIATGDYAEAVESLHAALTSDPNFACAYNALGVAYLRLGKRKDAQIAFERAAKLTPKWALPFFHFGQIFLTAGDAKNAVPFLEAAVQLNPNSLNNRWHLCKAYRLLDREPEFYKQVAEIKALDANYAPVYLEIGLYAQKRNEKAKAVEAFDTYLLLAPNFADSRQVKIAAEQIRSFLPSKKVKSIKLLAEKSQ